MLAASIATACLASATTGTAATLVSDDFTGIAASSGTTSGGLNSIGWYMYNSGTAGLAWTTATDSTSPLSGTVMSNPGGSAGWTCAFKQFTPTTLTNIGDSITLSLSFHALNAAATFHLSLLGSNQTITANQYGGTVLTDAAGYSFFESNTDQRSGMTTGNLGSLWEISGNNTPPYATADLTNVSVSTPVGTTAHAFSMTLTKTASGVAIDSSLDSTVFNTYTDTMGSIYTSFNTIRLVCNDTPNSFNVDNITVSTVPEPTSVALAALAGGVGMLLRFRRARR